MLLSLKILFIFKMGVTCIRYDLGKIKRVYVFPFALFPTYATWFTFTDTIVTNLLCILEIDYALIYSLTVVLNFK